jgi:hypothetical protein
MTHDDAAIRARRFPAAMLAVLLACTAATARGQEVVAVLSSDLQPYREALAGFEAAFGSPVTSVNLAAGEPRFGESTRVVVAFGGKAAVRSYPERAVLVYCMAPAITVAGANAVHVHMVPPPATLVTRLRQIQPGMRRLLVFWASPSLEAYLRAASEAATRIGLEMGLERVQRPDEIPARLRQAMQRHTDAVWLVHDPLLVNAATFSLLKEFSWENDVPFYAPNAGLVSEGAVASVSVGFRDIGRTAAAAARAILEHGKTMDEVYPAQSEVAINVTAAAAAGLRTPADILQKADRVIP